MENRIRREDLPEAELQQLLALGMDVIGVNHGPTPSVGVRLIW